MNNQDRNLLVSTGIGCGVLCSYCPQAKIGRAYAERMADSKMSLDTFKACVDKLPLDVAIHFNGFYEPWLNRDCAEMLLYADQRGFRVRVSTTLMGLGLEDIRRVQHIPFTKFAVHLPDNKELTRIKVDDHYMEVLSTLIDAGISRIGYHVHEGAAGPEDVHSRVSKLLHERGIVPEDRWVNTRAGNIEVAGKGPRQRLTGALQMCPRIQSGVLLPNGDVALCCMDWGLKHVLGNLLTMDYEMLFESEEFQRILRGYEDDSIDILCRYCELGRTQKDAQRKAALHELERRYHSLRSSYHSPSEGLIALSPRAGEAELRG